jgi:hypothetical protein
MINKMSRTSTPLTEEEIDRTEKRIGRRIPPAYRKFLLEYNGGSPDPSDFTMATSPHGKTELGTIKSFLGIGTDKATLNLDYILETFEGRLPADLFPIARDPGGNLIALGTEGSKTDKVYFWDHEREADEGNPPTNRNLYLVSESFDQFIGSLHEA